ncbi:MAG TPA: YdeI/OmpD-associated family protein [Planctomycetota bacterium]|nr:YdeI/OmpD-associated family protein [Planctomycetota bacterium]
MTRAPRAATDAVAFVAEVRPKPHRGGWVHVPLPAAATRLLGGRRAAPVIFVAEGRAFRTTALPDGAGGLYVNFNREMRDAVGRGVGDPVACEVRPDRAPRVVAAPDDLARALRRHAAASAGFEAMPPSHRRHLVAYLEEAKADATRRRRVEKCVASCVRFAEERAARSERRGAAKPPTGGAASRAKPDARGR